MATSAAPTAILQDAVQAVQSRGPDARDEFCAALDAACLEDSPAIYAALDDAARERVNSAHIPRVCVAAHAVDRAAAAWPEGQADAPEWYGQCVELALKWLQGQLAAAPVDTLQDVAEVRLPLRMTM